MKAFVVQGINWSYDDENYYQEGKGDAAKVFTFKDKAHEFAAELTAKRIQTEDVFMYAQYDDLTDEAAKEFNEQLEKICNNAQVAFEPVDMDDCCDWVVPDLKKDGLLQVAKLLQKLFNISFYEVIEVELDAEE